jgi:hypothetical protein
MRMRCHDIIHHANCARSSSHHVDKKRRIFPREIASRILERTHSQTTLRRATGSHHHARSHTKIPHAESPLSTPLSAQKQR